MCWAMILDQGSQTKNPFDAGHVQSLPDLHCILQICVACVADRLKETMMQRHVKTWTKVLM